MAKLAILAVVLVAVVAIAEATTTITTTVIEESLDENPQGRRQSQHGQCSQQLQGKGFTHCLNYLTQGGRSRGRGRVYSNPQQAHLQECCEQLESVDEDCRCAAIQKVLQRSQQERRSYQGQDMQEMMRTAQELPRQCQWNEPQQCQMRAVFV
ncbi:hypothetical protein LIER_28047 [Lithospermum erythrorhizon]|uniref:Bifunctional inhibitor/plant lipid transfer protein/seed storage helical domain-containing protein n=1 Tax=Lithospermum erythrorhizon TaxID=34254 RepID=A0AAV3RFY1_LITER